MSKKNQKRKKEMKEQQGCPRPWRQIYDTVVDAHGRIVKAPHGCSWEGDNYNDGAAAAQIIVESVNNSQQSQPVPDVNAMADALGDALRSKHAVFLSHTKLVNLVRAMLATAPKPGSDQAGTNF